MPRLIGPALVLPLCATKRTPPLTRLRCSGIYHLVDHPWTGLWFDGSYLAQHIAHISTSRMSGMRLSANSICTISFKNEARSPFHLWGLPPSR